MEVEIDKSINLLGRSIIGIRGDDSDKNMGKIKHLLVELLTSYSFSVDPSYQTPCKIKRLVYIKIRICARPVGNLPFQPNQKTKKINGKLKDGIFHLQTQQ